MRTRDLHLIEALSVHPAVATLLVVDRPVPLIERLARRHSWAVRGELLEERRVGRVTTRLTQVGTRTVVLDQLVPDVVGPVRDSRSWWFEIFERSATRTAIDWATDRALVTADAAVAWLPPVAPVLSDATPFVFDSLDNWLIHPAFDLQRPQAEAAYARLLPRAAKVFASAPASARVLERWREGVEVMPNGVDPAEFQRPRPRPNDLPPAPVVGYAGKLAKRIDTELIVATARALPRVSFAFIGPILDDQSIRALRSEPNVLLLGDMDYGQVPAYIQHFDVAWIPHRVGPGETGGDPIKLYEYQAAGRQIVSTRIDGWEGWGPNVAFVDSAAEAERTLAAILDGHLTVDPGEVSPDRTWSAIADRLLAPILG